MQSYIIGYPLNNPRSVKLWRNFFKINKMDIKMDPLSVRPEFLNSTILKLKKNKNFIASAITMPYKKLITDYSIYGNKLTKEVKSSNLIIKNNNNLICYNTDIEAALKSLPNRNFENIMIFGYGGVGEPLFKILYKKFNKSKFSVISKKNIKFSRRVNLLRKINENFFKKIDLFINCSPLGSNLKKNFLNKSPINYKILKKHNKKLFVFDIVYKPYKTRLSIYCKKLGIAYKNGYEMNSLQANIALKLVRKKYLHSK